MEPAEKYEAWGGGDVCGDHETLGATQLRWIQLFEMDCLKAVGWKKELEPRPCSPGCWPWALSTWILLLGKVSPREGENGKWEDTGEQSKCALHLLAKPYQPSSPLRHGGQSNGTLEQVYMKILLHRKFQLNMRKNFFPLRVTEHWNRLPREVA